MKTHAHKIAAGLLLLLVSSGVAAQTLQDAIRLTDNERYRDAKTILLQLVAKEPTNGDNYFYLGDLLLKSDDPDSAKIVFTKGMNINPTDPLTHVGMASYDFFTGNNEDGQKEIVAAKSLVQTQAGKKGLDMPKPRQAAIDLEIAEAYLWSKMPNYDDAINLTTLAENLDPKNPEVYIVRGDVLAKKDPVNATPAIESYVKAVTIDPKSCKANVRIGAIYAAGKNMPSAIGYYNLALKTDPTFAPAYRLRGEAQYMMGKFDSASMSYAAYLKLNPDCYSRYRYCAFLYKSGNFREAINQGKTVLACDSSLSVVYRILGMCYTGMKPAVPDSALLYFNDFFIKQKLYGKPELLPDDYLSRAGAYSMLKQDSLAILDYNSALAMDSGRTDIFVQVAAAYFKMRKFDQAEIYYKKKLDSDGDQASSSDLFAYGYAAYFSNDYVNADSAFVRMTVNDPGQTFGWLWAAKTSRKIDSTNEKWLAIPYYEKYFPLALANKDKNKKDLHDAARYVAGYFYVQKNFSCSKAFFQLALDLDPTDSAVKKELDTDKDLKIAQASDINTCMGAAGSK